MALIITALMWSVIFFHSIMDSEELIFHHPCDVLARIPFPSSYEPKYPPPFLISTPCCAFLQKEVIDYEVAKYSQVPEQELDEKNKTLNDYVQRLREVIPEFQGIGLLEIYPYSDHNRMKINFHLKFSTESHTCTRERFPKDMWENLRNEMNTALDTKISTGTGKLDHLESVNATTEINTVSVLTTRSSTDKWAHLENATAATDMNTVSEPDRKISTGKSEYLGSTTEKSENSRNVTMAIELSTVAGLDTKIIPETTKLSNISTSTEKSVTPTTTDFTGSITNEIFDYPEYHNDDNGTESGGLQNNVSFCVNIFILTALAIIGRFL